MQALTTGEALVAARRLMHGHGRALAQLAFVVLIPFQLLQFAVVVVGLRSAGTSRILSLSFAHIVVLGVSVFLSVAGITAAIAACHRLLMPPPDETVDADRALRWVLGRLSPVLAVAALTGLAVAVGTLLFVIPGVWAAFAFALAIPALLIEDVRGAGALERSRTLASGRMLIQTRQLAPAALALLAAVVLLSLAVGWFFGGEITIGSAFMQMAVNLLVCAVATPLLAALAHVAYLDVTDSPLLSRPSPVVAPPSVPASAPPSSGGSTPPPGRAAGPEDVDAPPEPREAFGGSPLPGVSVPAPGRDSVAPPRSSVPPPGG